MNFWNKQIKKKAPVLVHEYCRRDFTDIKRNLKTTGTKVQDDQTRRPNPTSTERLHAQVSSNLIGKPSVSCVGKTQYRIRIIQQGNLFIKLPFKKRQSNSAEKGMIAGEIKCTPD